MKILYIHQHFCPPEGYGNNRSLELSKFWVEMGHSVTMLTSSAQFPANHPVHQKNYHQENILGIDTHILNVPYSHYFGFSKRILSFLKFYFYADKYLRKIEKPDIIYASSTPPSVGELGKKWSQKWNIPLVFEVVDVWPDVPEQMGILKNRFLLYYLHKEVHAIYQYSQKIVALSPDMKKQISSHNIPEEKIIVSFNGTNTEIFKPLLKDNPLPKVIYAGAVGKVNDVTQYVIAAKELEGTAEFILLGNGNEANQVKKIVNKLNPKSFTWQTWVPKNEVANLIASCDIGVSTIANYPVLEANSANKFYDYLACGLPVLTNYKGWQAEFLENHHCGLSSELGNTKKFVENLQFLIQNHKLRKTFSANARNCAITFFDRKKIANELLKIFLLLK